MAGAERHGLPPISDEEARLFMGEGSKMTMRRAFARNGRTLDEAAASAVTREFVRYYEQDPVRYTTAFDGVAEIVKRLDRLGLRQGVGTNKFEKSARMILKGLSLMPPMTNAPSLRLGDRVPDFALPGLDGKLRKFLWSFTGDPVALLAVDDLAHLDVAQFGALLAACQASCVTPVVAAGNAVAGAAGP